MTISVNVRDLRNHYADLLKQVANGEEIIIKQRGVAVARLIQEKIVRPGKVDWSKSAAFRQTHKKTSPKLTAKESADLLAYGRG